MRVLVVVLVLVAAAGLWWFATGEADLAPSLSGERNAPSIGPAREGRDVSALPAGTIARRAVAEREPAAGLADTPTACLLIVDHATGAPVAGAAVRRVKNGDEIAFTDDHGRAAVALREPEQLAVVRDGYLLRLAPTRVGTTEAEPQRIVLVPDRWSPRVRFAFRDAEGGAVAAVFARFRSLAPQGAAPARPALPVDDVVVQRAWTEHAMLAGRPVAADVAVELGTWAEESVHHLADGQEVRFVVPGNYEVEFATVSGLVGRTRVTAAQTADGPPQRVDLAAGGHVTGLVVDASGAPLAACTATVEGGEPLGLVATTAADGAFRIAPLLPGPVTLVFRHNDHEPQTTKALQPPIDGLRVRMQPLPKSALRGRVRARPDLAPIAGAAIVWSPAGSAAVTVRSATDGTFVLHATGTAPARLAIHAPDHVPYAEVVEPGAPFADYDLWPATTDVRLGKKLSALLEGVVVDAAGMPQAGVAVRWIPAARTGTALVSGRRVLEGAALELPLVAATGIDGAFRLETNQFGPGRLVLAAGDPAGARGVDVEAVAGTTRNGLRLQR